jgi:predicted transcriptional regulator
MASETLTVRVDARAKKRLAKLAESTGRSQSFWPLRPSLDIEIPTAWQIKGIESALA